MEVAMEIICSNGKILGRSEKHDAPSNNLLWVEVGSVIQCKPRNGENFLERSIHPKKHNQWSIRRGAGAARSFYSIFLRNTSHLKGYAGSLMTQ